MDQTVQLSHLDTKNAGLGYLEIFESIRSSVISFQLKVEQAEETRVLFVWEYDCFISPNKGEYY